MSFSEGGKSANVNERKGSFESNWSASGRDVLGAFGSHAGGRRGRHWAGSVGVGFCREVGIIRHGLPTMTQIAPRAQPSFGNIR